MNKQKAEKIINKLYTPHKSDDHNFEAAAVEIMNGDVDEETKRLARELAIALDKFQKKLDEIRDEHDLWGNRKY